jgi:hypothetical protein
MSFKERAHPAALTPVTRERLDKTGPIGAGSTRQLNPCGTRAHSIRLQLCARRRCCLCLVLGLCTCTLEQYMPAAPLRVARSLTTSFARYVVTRLSVLERCERLMHRVLSRRQGGPWGEIAKQWLCGLLTQPIGGSTWHARAATRDNPMYTADPSAVYSPTQLHSDVINILA